MPYEITVCDGESCGVVGTARKLDVAKRKLTRELKKRAKARFGREKAPTGVIAGEVREVVRGVRSEDASYAARLAYGEPRPSRPKKPATPKLATI